MRADCDNNWDSVPNAQRAARTDSSRVGFFDEHNASKLGRRGEKDLSLC